MEEPRQLVAGTLDLSSQRPGDVVLTKHPGKLSSLNRAGQDMLRAIHILSGRYSRTEFGHVLICAGAGVFIHADGRLVLAQQAESIDDLLHPTGVVAFRHPKLGGDPGLQRKFTEGSEKFLQQKYGFVYAKSRLPLGKAFVKEADAKKFCSELVVLLLQEVGIPVSPFLPSETLPTDIFHFCVNEGWDDVTEQYYFDKKLVQLLSTTPTARPMLNDEPADADLGAMRRRLPSALAAKMTDQDLARAAWMSEHFTPAEILAGANNSLSRWARSYADLANAKRALYEQVCVVVAMEGLRTSAYMDLVRGIALVPSLFPRLREDWLEDISDIDAYYQWMDQSAWSHSTVEPRLKGQGFRAKPYEGVASVEDLVQMELTTKCLSFMARTLIIDTKLKLLLTDFLRENTPGRLPASYNDIQSVHYTAWCEGITAIDREMGDARLRKIDELDLSAFNESDATTTRSLAKSVVRLHSLYSLLAPA